MGGEARVCVRAGGHIWGSTRPGVCTAEQHRGVCTGCAHVCMCTGEHGHVCEHMGVGDEHGQGWARVCVCMSSCVHTYIHVHVYVHIPHVYSPVCMYMHVPSQLHVSTHTQLHTHTHTHTHQHTLHVCAHTHRGTTAAPTCTPTHTCTHTARRVHAHQPMGSCTATHSTHGYPHAHSCTPPWAQPHARMSAPIPPPEPPPGPLGLPGDLRAEVGAVETPGGRGTPGTPL